MRLQGRAEICPDIQNPLGAWHVRIHADHRDAKPASKSEQLKLDFSAHTQESKRISQNTNESEEVIFDEKVGVWRVRETETASR